MENVTCFSTARGPPFEVVCVCVCGCVTTQLLCPGFGRAVQKRPYHIHYNITY